MDTSLWIAGIGLLITFTTLIGNLLFKAGTLTARVDTIEKEMGSLTGKMSEVILSTGELKTLVEERTDRRSFTRPGV